MLIASRHRLMACGMSRAASLLYKTAVAAADAAAASNTILIAGR